MDGHLPETSGASNSSANPFECLLCSAQLVGSEKAGWLSNTACSCSLPTLRTSFSLKLAHHYLPRVWPGLILTLPALFVLPAYDKSLWFHIWMNMAWVYWIYCVFKLHATLKKKNQSYDVSPAKATAVAALVGSHPFNYCLEFFALLLAVFPETASGLLIVPAIPLAFIFGFWWYRRMFSHVCRFVAAHRPDEMPIKNPGGAIALCLLIPGALQLLFRALGLQSEYALWVSAALFPIGLSIAFCLFLSFRNKVTWMIADDADYPQLTQATSRAIGIKPSTNPLERSESID